MRYFLLSWDQEGFECVQDITQYHPDNWEKMLVLEALQGKSTRKNPMLQQLHAMCMRARFNSQRCYEIYVIEADDGVDEESIREWSDEDPQSLVDWVRKHHNYVVWNDRRDDKRVRIR